MNYFIKLKMTGINTQKTSATTRPTPWFVHCLLVKFNGLLTVPGRKQGSHTEHIGKGKNQELQCRWAFAWGLSWCFERVSLVILPSALWRCPTSLRFPVQYWISDALNPINPKRRLLAFHPTMSPLLFLFHFYFFFLFLIFSLSNISCFFSWTSKCRDFFPGS